jgi:hypothetical protein
MQLLGLFHIVRPAARGGGKIRGQRASGITLANFVGDFEGMPQPLRTDAHTALDQFLQFSKIPAKTRMS